MRHLWISIGLMIGLIMLWGGRYLSVGTSCGQKREETEQEAGPGQKILARSGSGAEPYPRVFEQKQEVESEGTKASLGGEEELEVRLVPVMLEEGSSAENMLGWEDLKWLVQWPMPGDEVGQRLLMIWQTVGGEISEAELAKQLGVTEQTARQYVKSYRESGSSLAVIDGRHFNGGQQVAYRLEGQKGEVVQECVLRLLLFLVD